MDITIAGSAANVALNDEEYGRVNIELAAMDGEIGVGQFPIPDDAGSGPENDGLQFMVEEGAALLSDGFIVDQDWQRGPFKVGDDREYSYSIQDANALLSGFRVIRSSPSETDYARVMAFAALDGPAWDTTWVLNASTVTMPAKKYDGDQGWGELITDVVEFTGKTLFLHDKAAGGRCLHYHLLTNGHTCGLAISDVIADLDSTTFAPINPVRQRTSIDLDNDILGRDQGNRTHLSTDGTSITAHDADGLQHQAIIEFEAASQSDLNVKTAAYLASQKNDQDTFTCSIGPLDDAALALIRNGDLIVVTSGAMGLTASTQRIAHMALSVWNGRQGLWLATLELGAPVRRRARVSVTSGARPVSVNEMLRTLGPFCIPQPQKETFVNNWTGTGPSTFDGSPDWKTDITGTSIIAASGALELISSSAGIGVSSEYIDLPFTLPLEFIVKCKMDSTGTGSLAQIWFGVVFREDGSAFPTARIDLTLDGAGGFDSTWIVMNASGGSTATFTINSAGIGDGTYFWVRMLIEEDGALSGAFSGVSSPTSYTNTASPPAAPPSVPTLIQLTSFETGVGPFFHTIFTIDEITILQGLPYFCDSGTIETPTTGQWVYGEIVGTGDGVTTTFSLDHPPYVPGSLTLRCDIVEEAYVGGNPTTGVVTFSSPPFDTETIYADYQRA